MTKNSYWASFHIHFLPYSRSMPALATNQIRPALRASFSVNRGGPPLYPVQACCIVRAGIPQCSPASAAVITSFNEFIISRSAKFPFLCLGRKPNTLSIPVRVTNHILPAFLLSVGKNRGRFFLYPLQACCTVIGAFPHNSAASAAVMTSCNALALNSSAIFLSALP